MLRERMRHTSPRHRQIKPILVLVFNCECENKRALFFMQTKQQHQQERKKTFE